MDLISFFGGIVFIIAIVPLIENIMALIFSVFEIIQLKLELKKTDLSQKIIEAQAKQGESSTHAIGFQVEDDDYG